MKKKRGVLKTLLDSADEAAESEEFPEFAKDAQLLRNVIRKVADEKKPDPDTEPDWGSNCELCGESPIVPATGMCGPCTWGEADTAGGNW